MLSASCPSCGSPVSFRHAASVAVVCEACRSVVVREGVDLKAIGKSAPFARDLSPLQIGATGSYGGRGFRVLGVVRLGRERVRWNEWFLQLDDGATAWLAEGNELWQIFVRAPTQGRFPPHHEMAVGKAYAHAEVRWRAIEVAVARVQAAEGELPYRPTPGTLRPYVDLREANGSRSATLDYEVDPAVLWTGEVVELPALKMEGLRPFAGWSDPSLVAFAGPDVAATRSLACPSCGAPTEIRAPGQSVTLTCGYCGSDLSVDERGTESALSLIQKSEQLVWKPTLPLGKRGTLAGVPWEVIGAMERSVRVDGTRYAWVEYLLHNPYRGWRWLVQDGQDHWSLVQRLPGLPSIEGNRAAWRDARFDHFQSGEARTDRVLGEFTWEVHRGDVASTADFVAPPRMLSKEATGDEVVWSIGTWLPHTAIAEAFKVDLPTPTGIAPHQPNPYQEPAAKRAAWTTAALGCGAAVVIWLLHSLLSANETLLTQTWQTTPNAEDIWVSDAFAVPDGGRNSLHLEVSSTLDRDLGEVHVALLHEAGEAVLPQLDGGANSGDAWIADPAAGSWVARVEVAKNPTVAAATLGQTVRLEIVRDAPWRVLDWAALLVPLLVPLGLTLAAGQVEKQRWANSDHA